MKIRKSKVSGFSVDSVITVNQRAKLKYAGFGGTSWKNIRVVLPRDAISIEAFANRKAQGLIGQEFLQQFIIIYDYPNGACYFRQL